MTLQELVAKYPEIFVGGSYQIPKGWIGIVDDMCSSIQSYIHHSSRYVDGEEFLTPQVICTQMKEKWGGLRFYYKGGDDTTYGMIYMTQHLSWSTCDECSSRENVGHITSGWHRIMCQSCAEEANLTWEPFKKPKNQ